MPLHMTRKLLEFVSKSLAVAGGLILLAIAMVTLVSIIGRAFIFAGLRPVKGDFELVEIGCAIAVFYFLPICQLKHGNVSVDLFSNIYSVSVRRLQVAIADLAFTVVGIVITRQMWLGLWEKVSYQETTFILGLPVWYGYALGLVGAFLFAITAAFTTVEAISALFGRNQEREVSE